MSKPFKRYTVTLMDTLQVQVEVIAQSPTAARHIAFKEWFDALWKTLAPQLENSCCTIIAATSLKYAKTCLRTQPPMIAIPNDQP